MKMLHKMKGLTAAILMAAALPVLADSSDMNNAMSDTMITAKIKSALVSNKITHASDIAVATNNGVVSLSGMAKTDTEATQAVEIAESTKDVKNVDASQLKVTDSTQPMTDAYITAKVKGVFIKNNLTMNEKNVPVTSVKVETKDGAVILSGSVEKESEINKLVKLAKSVDGVTSVKTLLTVKK